MLVKNICEKEYKNSEEAKKDSDEVTKIREEIVTKLSDINSVLNEIDKFNFENKFYRSVELSLSIRRKIGKMISDTDSNLSRLENATMEIAMELESNET